MELNEIQTCESRTTLHHFESIETLNELRHYTFLEHMKRAVRLVTVEPAIFLYLVATLLAGGAVFNMMFEMGCRVNLHLNDTLCTNITIGIRHVRVLLGNSDAWSRLVQQTVSIIMVVCFGTFSDRHNIRKPLFTIPILGEVFSCLGLILCAVFISQWPVEIYFVMALIVPAFFGSPQTIFVAFSSYITDITTQECRTNRLGFAEVLLSVLTPITSNAASVLFIIVGYYGVYSISLVLFVAALLYGQFFIQDKPPPKRDINLCVRDVVGVLNIKSVVIDMFKILIQKRVAYRRFLLIMSYVCYILIKGPVQAERLYMRNYALHTFHWGWSAYVQVYDSIAQTIGFFLVLILLTMTIKLNDYVIVIISCIIKIIVDIWYVYSGTNLILFCIGPMINGFSGFYTVPLRSVVTKLVNPSEIARALALFAICDELHPIMYNFLYAKFFRATWHGFYGAFFLLSAALMVISVFILLGMYLLYKHDLEHPQPEQQNEHQNEMEQYTNDIEIGNL